MTDITAPANGRLNRRSLLTGAFALGALTVVAQLAPFAVGHAGAQSAAAAQQIADHFASVKTMSGEFVQFGPKGEQTGGKFFIQRPGKIRFNYEAPSKFRVVSDGDQVVLFNDRLRTAEMYALSRTPLKALLDERIDLGGGKVTNVRQESDLTTIQMADKSMFGNSTISMMFDPKSFELRQWTITDAQGKDTTVMIFNVQQGVAIDPSIFAIDYAKVNELSPLTRNNR